MVLGEPAVDKYIVWINIDMDFDLRVSCKHKPPQCKP
jgi:hypothetical protein